MVQPHKKEERLGEKVVKSKVVAKKLMAIMMLMLIKFNNDCAKRSEKSAKL